MYRWFGELIKVGGCVGRFKLLPTAMCFYLQAGYAYCVVYRTVLVLEHLVTFGPVFI